MIYFIVAVFCVKHNYLFSRVISPTAFLQICALMHHYHCISLSLFDDHAIFLQMPKLLLAGAKKCTCSICFLPSSSFLFIDLERAPKNCGLVFAQSPIPFLYAKQCTYLYEIGASRLWIRNKVMTRKRFLRFVDSFCNTYVTRITCKECSKKIGCLYVVRFLFAYDVFRITFFFIYVICNFISNLY